MVGWPDVAIGMACQAFVILNSLNATLIISPLRFTHVMYQLCVSEVFTTVIELGGKCLLYVCVVSKTTVSCSRPGAHQCYTHSIHSILVDITFKLSYQGYFCPLNIASKLL